MDFENDNIMETTISINVKYWYIKCILEMVECYE